MLWIVVALLILMAAFHSIIGECLILTPVRQKAILPKIWGSEQAMFRTIQATWHLVSILWLGLSATLVTTILYPAYTAKGILYIFGSIFAVLTIVPLVWDAGKHKTWIVFGIIAGILLISAYRM